MNAAAAGEGGNSADALEAGSGLANATGVGVKRPGSSAATMIGWSGELVDGTAAGSGVARSVMEAAEEIFGSELCGTAGTCKSRAAIARIISPTSVRCVSRCR
jgi:hypothetical protein